MQTINSSLILVKRPDSDSRETVAEYFLPDGAGEWKTEMTFSVFFGKNGFGKTREGDLKTPLGEFGAVTAFGIKGDPGTDLPYIDVEEDTLACDSDCLYYNKIVRLTELKSLTADGVSGEHMCELAPEYNYGIALDYNPECVYPLGSAIFFHCKGAKPWTGGCIAADEDVVRHILRTCGPAPLFRIL